MTLPLFDSSVLAFVRVLALLAAAAGPPSAQAQPAAVEADRDYTIWQNVREETTEDGRSVLVTNTWVELGDGLNWRDPSGAWVPTQPEFAAVPGGFAVETGNHKVFVPDTLGTRPVEVTLPDGQVLRSSPRFLSFFDRSSGQTVLLGQVKDCAGELIAPSVVLFPDAFDTVKAALRYTYSNGAFEQDVILYQATDPGSPAESGLDPATTTLEMFTEFLQAPAPDRSTLKLANGLDDQRLDFGTMALGEGVAYVLGREVASVEVGKTWEELEGRDYLIESISYCDLKTLLDRAGLVEVAPTGEASLPGQPQAKGRAGLVRLLSDAQKARPLLVAGSRQSGLASPGVVLDYRLTLTGPPQDGLFRSDYTYYVSSSFTVNGLTTFEPAVIKYAPGAYIECNGPVVCRTDPGRPLILTARDDDTVGELLPESQGTAAIFSQNWYYANPALKLRQNGTQLHDLRVSHAQLGLFFYDFSAGATPNVVTHAQFVRCTTGLQVNGYGTTFQNFRLGNVLLNNVGTVFYGYSFAGTLEHLTLNGVTTLACDYRGATTGPGARSCAATACWWRSPPTTTTGG